MVKPVIEDSDEEGNANLTSSDDCESVGRSAANNSEYNYNSINNRSFQTNNKMADMLDGFSMGRGLYTNAGGGGGGQKEECGDGDLSDAGVESIILSSDEDKDWARSNKDSSEKEVEVALAPLFPKQDFTEKIKLLYHNNNL